MFEDFTGKIIWSVDGLTDKELMEIVTRADFPARKSSSEAGSIILDEIWTRDDSASARRSEGAGVCRCENRGNSE